ncbi:T9SS type B sorting domain-containing protein [Chryseobacterium sp. MMS23-Vi53]|uniref:T9SS type B sorting domain-containing protein n=1 Tax=Chryseobacterium sp. MMS23-Vi53 TaxID=3386644 RepID=UPI0039E7F598
MKKHLYSLLLVLFTALPVSAQRDTEHWFAPLSTSLELFNPQQAVYLSTDSGTSFPVEIYNNGTLLGTIAISKGNPKTLDIPTSMMIATTDAELFTPTTKGLYLKAEKPFFATFRFSVTSHAEILTSKGKAGIGTKFYAVVSPITNPGNFMNFTTGVLATEDNTVVTVSGYAPTVVFSNGVTAASTPSFSFTLNKGQSYIIEGKGNTAGNEKGFIGAKITSDKPITITNGNFLGEYNIGTAHTGGDIVMDQSVPVERLGKEFVLVKGFGNISAATEDALIVATENNTEIYVNGSLTPVKTINEGQHYRVNETSNTNYINQGNDHYNMYIRTSKRAYVYQLLAGTPNSSATIGFNYIPPLNCLLPRKIDEIGMIDILPPTINTVKLNILTEKGATVAVNGNNPSPTEGPYDVSGTLDWVSYSIPDVKGNITVTSTKAVTAGIAGGSGVVGYGGYFAGFSSIPVISKKSGNCIPGIVLQVNDNFEGYQWYVDGNPISGATNSTHTPLQPGKYSVQVSMGGCSAFSTEYAVELCYDYTVKTVVLCENSKTINPQFTNSQQALVVSTLGIDTPPSHGTATINPTTGAITYTPNSGFTGNDLMVYHFCGNPAVAGCEQVTLTLTVAPSPVVKNVNLRSCYIEANPSTASFNLESAAVTSEFGTIKKYYPTLADLNNGTNEILPPKTTNYIASSGTVYVKVINTGGCFSIAEITLTVLPPVKSRVLEDKIICIENTTTLDAGSGFDGYQWSTGETTQSIIVGVGSYWVNLKTGECFTKQLVKVSPSIQPVISSLDIKNNTITVNVIGGTPPYKYSIDGVKWQDSNFFANLPRGENTVYVKDFYNCEPIDVTVTVPNLINAITPNGDNKNDYVDYSELSYKKNLTFNIFDRYGNKIHEANKFSGYKWDGTHFGKKVPTATYWYEINWTEPNKAQTVIRYTGWILVKNLE